MAKTHEIIITHVIGCSKYIIAISKNVNGTSGSGPHDGDKQGIGITIAVRTAVRKISPISSIAFTKSPSQNDNTYILY